MSEHQDLAIEINQEGVSVLRKKVVAQEWGAHEEFEWDEIKAMRITDIEEFSRDSAPKSPFIIHVSNAEISIGNDDASFSIASNGDSEWNELLDATGISYFEQTGHVDLNDDKSNNHNFKDFLRFMFDSGYLSEEDLPISMPSATKNYIISSEPVNQKGEEAEHMVDLEIPDVGTIYYNPKSPLGQKKEHIDHIIKSYK